ncbi:hypothetical protein [Mariniluteicoccus flavus]
MEDADAEAEAFVALALGADVLAGALVAGADGGAGGGATGGAAVPLPPPQAVSPVNTSAPAMAAMVLVCMDALPLDRRPVLGASKKAIP